ncbi:hypothetical protein SD10_13315 [Spirosoma radiotolerans]|uniref:Uncharacterized protein n=1 Tax=Spirosoma radiotolerans TaxID=1379870 RepID=A0A0E3ZVD4_9BACT|nr:hypothetical protein SD10_13315 [Spirosoma radiotolerans]
MELALKNIRCVLFPLFLYVKCLAKLQKRPLHGGVAFFKVIQSWYIVQKRTLSVRFWTDE